MKRERYFQDELWRMFVTYAILPAALFTFICGVLFMTVLLHGRERANREYLSYVNGRVNQMVESCEQELKLWQNFHKRYQVLVMCWRETVFFRVFMGFPGRWDMNRKCIW